MKRKILFRGLPKSNDEYEYYGFVYGLPMEFADGSIYIRQKETGQQWEIIPETLSECTMVICKNGDSIYEGDILTNSHGIFCEVIYENGGFIAKGKGFFIIITYFWNCNVIGNIYENPELINVDF